MTNFILELSQFILKCFLALPRPFFEGFDYGLAGGLLDAFAAWGDAARPVANAMQESLKVAQQLDP